MGILDRRGLDPGPAPNHIDTDENGWTSAATVRCVRELCRQIEAVAPDHSQEAAKRFRDLKDAEEAARINDKDEEDPEYDPERRLLAKVDAETLKERVIEYVEAIPDSQLRRIFVAIL